MKGYRRSKRDANHGPICRALAATGVQCYDQDGSKFDDPGRPDVLAVWSGGFCWIEFKMPGEDLSDSQRKWWANYRGPAGTLVLATTLDEALAATGRRRAA